MQVRLDFQYKWVLPLPKAQSSTALATSRNFSRSLLYPEITSKFVTSAFLAKMKKIFLCLLITTLAAEMMADYGHHGDGPIIVLQEYPEEVVFEVRPDEERVKQWQAVFTRGETGGAGLRDQQKKRNVDVINSLLALPKGLNAAGRR